MPGPDQGPDRDPIRVGMGKREGVKGRGRVSYRKKKNAKQTPRGIESRSIENCLIFLMCYEDRGQNAQIEI